MNNLNIKTKTYISCEFARSIGDTSWAKAKELDRKVAICVVGGDGEPLVTYCHEDCEYIYAEWALYKAKTAWFKQKYTEECTEFGTGKLEIVKIDKSIMLMGIAGGIPLGHNGDKVGGIGVCGVPAEIDKEIGMAGKEVFDKEISNEL